jgi:hypothetical protein
MTKQYDNNMRGALWVNNNEKKGAPKWTGNCEINGQTYRIAMWPQKEGARENAPEYSLTFEVPRQ